MILLCKADDDGSGTTSILDAFRVLAASSYKPTTSAVEFHWYSAEEGGLLGSQAVAKVYEEDKVDVKGMIQMDMTGTFPTVLWWTWKKLIFDVS